MSKVDAQSDNTALVLMAEVVGVHGIKGNVKLKIFGKTPEDLPSLSPLCDATQETHYEITSLKKHGVTWLAVFNGVQDRTAAEKMRGVKLYTLRQKLPEVDSTHTFYHADLIGLAAIGIDGTKMGAVINVANFGAGDLLEIAPPQGQSFYVPFTQKIVPDVNLAEKKLTVDPPPGLLD